MGMHEQLNTVSVCDVSVFLSRVEKEKGREEKAKTFNTVFQETTTNRWKLAVDMKPSFPWILGSIAFVFLLKEVLAC